MNALKWGLTGKLSDLHKHSNSPLGSLSTAQDILLAAVKAHIADCSRIALQAPLLALPMDQYASDMDPKSLFGQKHISYKLFVFQTEWFS